jgi:uncharacterized spore protein YtfJ
MAIEDIQELVKTTLDQIERILSTKTVIGEPITVQGNTLLPIVTVGFAFASGGLTGRGGKERGEGGGNGIVGGGGVRPMALIVIDKDGNIKVESTSNVIVPVTGRVLDFANKVVERFGKKEEGK